MSGIDLGVLIAPTGVESGLAMYSAQDLNIFDGRATLGQVFIFETPAAIFTSQYSAPVAIYYEYADHVVTLTGVNCSDSTNLQPSTKYAARVTSVAEQPDSIYETAEIISSNVIDLGVLTIPEGIQTSLALYAVQDLNAGIDIATVGQVFIFETPEEIFESTHSGQVAIYYEYADHIVTLTGTCCLDFEPSTKYIATVTSVAEQPDSIYETADIF